MAHLLSKVIILSLNAYLNSFLCSFHRIRGDQQHFVRRDELKVHKVNLLMLMQYSWHDNIITKDCYLILLFYQAAWEIFTPLLHRIDKGEFKSLPYKPGSRGPEEADKLLEKAGYVQTHGYIWIPPTL